MPILTVDCPDCNTTLRMTVRPVDQPTEFTVTCPKCLFVFGAEAEPEARPADKPTRTPRWDEDDDQPERRTDTGLIAAVVVAGVLLIGVAVVAVVSLGGN